MSEVQDLRNARRALVRTNTGVRIVDGRRICHGCQGAFLPAEYGGNNVCATCWRLRRYGLTPETYAALPGADGVCPVCKVGEAAHIDHDHSCCPGRRSCGQCVRGVLCASCNKRIGHLEALIASGVIHTALAWVAPS